MAGEKIVLSRFGGTWIHNKRKVREVETGSRQRQKEWVVKP